MEKPSGISFEEMRYRILLDAESKAAYDELSLLYKVKEALIRYRQNPFKTTRQLSDELDIPTTVLLEATLRGESLSVEKLNLILERIQQAKGNQR